MRGPLTEPSEVKTVKRLSFVLLAAFVLVIAVSGTAYANFGPHGGYTGDTDGCAGCHRAHTSFSTLGWTDLQGEQRTSALLISDAANMTDFCYACHGDAAPGASTNVQSGIYDSGPSGGVAGIALNPTGVTVFANTNSSYEATLNGGGFDKVGANRTVMSAHDMPLNATGPRVNAKVGAAIMWGGDTNTPIGSFRCTSCHDPHGSSNYRLLKDDVNGKTVGGYNMAGLPNAYVLSNEEGFPTGGFKKGDAGAADVAAYIPNYTSPQYAKNSGRAMSVWCSACHTDYNLSDGVAGNPTGGTSYGVYEAVNGTPLGAKVRHRHPVDVPLSVGTDHNAANRALTVALEDDAGLPLEMGIGTLASGANHQSAKIWDETGNVSCLTCHFAHGSPATMTGWAVAQLAGTTATPAPQKLTPGNTSIVATQGNPMGVNPNFSQSLLRYDNRGVCERCHNK
jgi:predicted CXXCH cytochrome family protein